MGPGVPAVAQQGSRPTVPWEDGVHKFQLCQIFLHWQKHSLEASLPHLTPIRQFFAWAQQPLLFAKSNPSAHLLPPPLLTLTLLKSL